MTMRLLATALIASLLFVVVPSPAPAEPVPAGTVIFRADFDTWDGRFQIQNGDNVTWITNGALALGLDRDAAGNLVEARLDTRSTFTFTYGTIRARMKFYGPKGGHAAVWAQSSGPGAYCDGCAEIDLAENFGNPNNAWHQLWWCPGGCAQANTNLEKAVPVDASEYHVYRVDWTPTGYAFRVDGVDMATFTDGLSDTPHYLALTYLVSAWELPNLQDRLGPYRAWVDWVEVRANAWTDVP